MWSIGKKYYLRIANCEYASDDLAELEEILYRYAVAEELVVSRAALLRWMYRYSASAISDLPG
jgi:hypothetical protein